MIAWNIYQKGCRIMFTLDRVETQYRLEASMKSWTEYNDSSLAILVLPREAPIRFGRKKQSLHRLHEFHRKYLRRGMYWRRSQPVFFQEPKLHFRISECFFCNIVTARQIFRNCTGRN